MRAARLVGLIVFAGTALHIASGSGAAATCDDASSTAAPSLKLSQVAHELNQDFIAKVTSRRTRDFRPQVRQPTVFTAEGLLSHVSLESEKFFTYVTDNGWNNQLLNLLCALDMARLLNRTLIAPPFKWARRRGAASVSIGRLVDLRALARTGVRVLAEDEHGSVIAALNDASAASSHGAAPAAMTHLQIAGEGQPHRKRRMPRWDRDEWMATRRHAPEMLLSVSCCLFWTWPLPQPTARELYAAFAYHPALVAAARAAAAPLGPDFGSMHVRRGDKASVDVAYKGVFGEKMDGNYFGRLATAAGLRPGATVFVATDELSREWFAPLRASHNYTLRFVDELAQPPLLDALAAFPQALWADVLAILEQQVCIDAPGGFVGSLPSTLSGHVINARATAGPAAAAADADDGAPPPLPLFTKVHESCCDARTARDWLVGGLALTEADLPCVAHEPWC